MKNVTFGPAWSLRRGLGTSVLHDWGEKNSPEIHLPAWNICSYSDWLLVRRFIATPPTPIHTLINNSEENLACL